MLYKAFLLNLAALVLALAPWSVFADPASGMTAKPIYVVDMQKVLSDSIAGKAVRNDLESEAKKSEAKLERARLDMKSFQESLTKQQSLLSGSAMEQKRETLAQKGREFQRMADDEREALDRKKAKEIRRIVLKAQELVSTIAKENNYELVIERDPQAVLFVDSKFDLTSEVVKRLDKEKLSF